MIMAIQMHTNVKLRQGVYYPRWLIRNLGYIEWKSYLSFGGEFRRSICWYCASYDHCSVIIWWVPSQILLAFWSFSFLCVIILVLSLPLSLFLPPRFVIACLKNMILWFICSLFTFGLCLVHSVILHEKFQYANKKKSKNMPIFDELLYHMLKCINMLMTDFEAETPFIEVLNQHIICSRSARCKNNSRKQSWQKFNSYFYQVIFGSICNSAKSLGVCAIYKQNKRARYDGNLAPSVLTTPPLNTIDPSESFL